MAQNFTEYDINFIANTVRPHITCIGYPTPISTASTRSFVRDSPIAIEVVFQYWMLVNLQKKRISEPRRSRLFIQKAGKN